MQAPRSVLYRAKVAGVQRLKCCARFGRIYPGVRARSQMRLVVNLGRHTKVHRPGSISHRGPAAAASPCRGSRGTHPGARFRRRSGCKARKAVPTIGAAKPSRNRYLAGSNKSWAFRAFSLRGLAQANAEWRLNVHGGQSEAHASRAVGTCRNMPIHPRRGLCTATHKSALRGATAD